jgi:hypothetical protein
MTGMSTETHRMSFSRIAPCSWHQIECYAARARGWIRMEEAVASPNSASQRPATPRAGYEPPAVIVLGNIAELTMATITGTFDGIAIFSVI